MRIDRVNTVIYCRSFSATVQFYRDVLGLTPGLEKDWFVEFNVAPGAFLSVADERRATIKSAAGLGLTISLHVDDVEKARKELAGRGAAPGPLRHVWGSRAFYIWDPEGNRLELWS